MDFTVLEVEGLKSQIEREIVNSLSVTLCNVIP